VAKTISMGCLYHFTNVLSTILWGVREFQLAGERRIWPQK